MWGKSTLMNVLVGERLSIITSKAQTTRHRIFGILSGEDFQIVYSDTPGLIEKPQYELHKSMMGFINSSLEDADVILFVADLYDKEMEQEMIDRVAKAEVPVILIINKIDLAKSEEQIEEVTTYWQERLKPHATLKISALAGTHTEALLPMIMDLLPEHPAYFDKEELSDRNERFFASEIIREKIFTNYKKEVPYSTEVAVTSFKEEEDIIRIHAEIFVERKSQKGILIGEGGKAPRKLA